MSFDEWADQFSEEDQLDLRLGDAWNAAIEATLAELLADGCISEQYRAEWLAATDPLKVQF